MGPQTDSIPRARVQHVHDLLERVIMERLTRYLLIGMGARVASWHSILCWLLEDERQDDFGLWLTRIERLVREVDLVAANVEESYRMPYLKHGESPGADAPMQPLQPQVAAPHSDRADAVPQVQEQVLESPARAQDRPRPARGQAVAPRTRGIL